MIFKLHKCLIVLTAAILSVLMTSAAFAQQEDSLQLLTLRDYHRIIMAHHPVASQADLLTEQARQELRIARGSFDPVLSSRYHQKEYNGTEYYTHWNNSLRVPTWYGPEFVAGYDQTQGQFLNPEASTPERGLSYIGVSVPLGQGLFIDERRSVLRQAALMQDIAEAERIKLINKLLLEATKDYWDWLLYYREVQLYEEALDLAEFILEGVQMRVQEGDLAAIDTVEALMAVQDRKVMLEQSKLQYRNTRLMVATHLWSEDQIPLELKENTVPALIGSELTAMPQDSVEELISMARANHPELMSLNLKGQQLEIEQRLAANKLLPKLNAEYNVLQSDFFLGSEALDGQYMRNNYRLGANFSIPLFLREERGKLQLTKAKRETNSLEQIQTIREIENNLLAAFNEWQTLEVQIRLQEQTVANAETLRDGEIIRFQNDESSLFLVNTREVKLMESKLKLYELRTKYAKSKTMLYWTAGDISVDRLY